MILEVWSLNINTELSDPSIKATYTIYNRMSILLKSLISTTRVTPAYKLSRRQAPDSYSIYYRIYSGEPQHNLGEFTCFLCFTTTVHDVGAPHDGKIDVLHKLCMSSKAGKRERERKNLDDAFFIVYRNVCAVQIVIHVVHALVMLGLDPL